MFEHTLRKMHAFPLCTQVVVTRFEEIENAAKTQGMLVVQNTEPDLGIAHSLKLGLKRALDENPGLKGAMFIVCDQPGLTAGTFARMLEMGKMHPGKIVCAGWKGRTGNPVLWDSCFSGSCADFPVIKAENRSSVHIKKMWCSVRQKKQNSGM